MTTPNAANTPGGLKRLAEKLLPLPPLNPTPAVAAAPPELYGGEQSVRERSRLLVGAALLNLGLVLVVLFAVPVLVPDEYHGKIMVPFVLWMVTSLYIYVALCDNGPACIAEKRLLQLGAAHLNHLPARLVADPLFETYLRQVRLNVTPKDREVMDTLLEDGFDGSVAELLDAAKLLTRK